MTSTAERGVLDFVLVRVVHVGNTTTISPSHILVTVSEQLSETLQESLRALVPALLAGLAQLADKST